MTNFFSFGKIKIRQSKAFTLVELLAVIAIIAMLAGLILPAINAARENGRRVQCTNNQSQIALSLINYEGAKGQFPPLRRERWESSNRRDWYTLSWVSFLLPFNEQSAAWSLLANAKEELYRTDLGTLETRHPVYDMVLPGWHCPSSGTPSNDNRINYVVNAGPQNVPGNTPADALDWDTITIPHGGRGTRAEFGNTKNPLKWFGVFFDTDVWDPVLWNDSGGLVRLDEPGREIAVNLEYIAAHDGTSKTILLSENMDAGHWIWELAVYDIEDGTNASNHCHLPVAGDGISNISGEHAYMIESLIAFCYPHELLPDANGTPEQVPNYVPLDTSSGQDKYFSPLWINEGTRANIAEQYRKARPSSGHPGIVMTGMCDRSVRVLRDDMDKTIFVRLCRTHSGVLIDMKKLD